jgi:hypothetical protein
MVIFLSLVDFYYFSIVQAMLIPQYITLIMISMLLTAYQFRIKHIEVFISPITMILKIQFFITMLQPPYLAIIWLRQFFRST